MNYKLRKQHFFTWIVVTVMIILLLVIAIVLRP